jgi:hypothetical protein
MVGGSYGSRRGSSAKRLMTSRARRRVLLADRDAPVVGGLHDQASGDVAEVQRAAVGAAGGVARQRPDRLVPHALGGDVDQ